MSDPRAHPFGICRSSRGLKAECGSEVVEGDTPKHRIILSELELQGDRFYTSGFHSQ